MFNAISTYLSYSKFINDNNPCIFNNKTPTHLNPSTGSHSTIDIALSDPSGYLDYIWKVHYDRCGSDNVPIILEITQPKKITDFPTGKQTKLTGKSLKNLCDTKLLYDPNGIVLIKHFSETLIPIENKHNTPWFNNDSKIAIRERNVALRKFTRNLNSFKQVKAKARKTIKQAKRTSWQNFVNQLNSSTKTNTVWKMVRKTAGKNQPTPLKHLIKNNIQITNIKDIADTLADTFSTNSSSKNSKTEFRKYKATTEK